MLNNCQTLYIALLAKGIKLIAINLGGGLPSDGYLYDGHPKYFDFKQYLQEISSYIDKFTQYCNSEFKFMIEPGRFLVSNAGTLVSKVLLDTLKQAQTGTEQWLYLDIGKYGGLYEASEILYAVRHLPLVPKDTIEKLTGMILAGPSCDSADMLVLSGKNILLVHMLTATPQRHSMGLNHCRFWELIVMANR